MHPIQMQEGDRGIGMGYTAFINMDQLQIGALARLCEFLFKLKGAA